MEKTTTAYSCTAMNSVTENGSSFGSVTLRPLEGRGSVTLENLPPAVFNKYELGGEYTVTVAKA